MSNQMDNQLSPVLYFPHGGGPMPLLGDSGHKNMIDFLQAITPTLGNPSAILVISAHWEENIATITSGKAPSLIYDYYGFPEESYQIKYPAPGDPILAQNIFQLLQKSGISAKLNNQRGFDHGLFVPLKIMYPEATIPCVQLSLIHNLDPEIHIQIGKALADLRKENVLILGSGFSFHNLNSFFSNSSNSRDLKNEKFQEWLIQTCSEKSFSLDERTKRLKNWQDAPFARYCHPREEHLLPLHVCYGMSDSPAKLVFNNEVMNKKTCAFLW